MYAFVFVALAMAVIHLEAAWRRPRVAIFVSAALWLLYAYYEHLIASGVLCDANCNIRVDLLLFIPVLYIATHYAWWTYRRPPEQRTIIGMVLGACGLLLAALLTAAFGYPTPAWIIGAAALGLLGYAIKTKRATRAM